MALNRVSFMNTYVDNITLGEAVSHIEACIGRQTPCYVVTPNVDQIVKMEYDKYFKQIFDESELSLLDGHPLLWIAKLYKKPFKEKICGSDLMLELCELAARKKYSVFLLGSAPGVAKEAVGRLQNRYKGLVIAGTYSPPLGFENNQKEIDKINKILLKSQADMLFVGMGDPKQSIFIYENRNNYLIPISFSFGAAIDFIAGKQKRAPKWMRQRGFEWLYRLIKEPRRMFKRYLINDMKIFKLIWKYR